MCIRDRMEIEQEGGRYSLEKPLIAITKQELSPCLLYTSCVWEAALSASKFKADHLIGILDNNGVQLDGTLEDIMPMGDIKAKWEAFGWNVIPCDGHDVEDICRAVEEAKMTADKPSLILAKTVKGKGVSFMEGKNTWHGKAIGDQEYAQAKAELGGDR